MCGLHRDAVDSEERAVRRCLERGEAAAVDELGEEYRSATHERAVEALAAEEDAARGQLVGEEREDMCGLHRDAVDSEERAVRPLPGARRGCSCGRARRGVQERDARASSGGASRGGGRRSRSARSARSARTCVDCTAMPWIPRRERCAAAWSAARLQLWTSSERSTGARRTSEQWRR
ncbi:hypothetical protein TcYC6_0092620 [Trypanosoma cruzi]|nr:hypothetical protein TcYC6_0092620 [Trypanosoma cruzi]